MTGEEYHERRSRTFSGDDLRATRYRAYGGAMKLILALAVVMTASLVFGQIEYAPTVAQCQADQRLWWSRLENPKSTLPAYGIMTDWVTEMDNCQKVDPNSHFKYYNTEVEIITERMLRLEHFLNRDQLWNKFTAEDAAGNR